MDATEPSRHLKGDWIAYWEHELGHRNESRSFDFKQIGLQMFVGEFILFWVTYALVDSSQKSGKLWIWERIFEL